MTDFTPIPSSYIATKNLPLTKQQNLKFNNPVKGILPAQPSSSPSRPRQYTAKKNNYGSYSRPARKTKHNVAPLFQHLNACHACNASPNFSEITSYFDMGGLASCIWQFIQWSNSQNGEVFQVAAFNTYLQSLFNEMKTAGMTQLDLAFSQLCDIDAFASGNYSSTSGNDVIAQLLQQMVSSNIIFPPDTNLLQLITTAASNAGVTISLSYGGENASPTDFTICQQGETPAGQAQKLANFIATYGIGSVDFDIEGSTAQVFAQSATAVPFFTALHQALNGQKPVTLTIQGSLTQTVWGSGGGSKKPPSTFNGPLKGFFFDQNNQPVFDTMFDGVNLMMYDCGNKYYLDAKVHTDDTVVPDWCIEDWLDIVGSQNANMVRIGFQDATAYQLDSSSASGHTYDKPLYPGDPLVVLPTDSPGTAGAKIFLQIQREMYGDGYTTPLGPCFWWPNYNGNRYAPNSQGQAQFTSQPMNDFETTLQQLGACSVARSYSQLPLSYRIKQALLEAIKAFMNLISLGYINHTITANEETKSTASV